MNVAFRSWLPLLAALCLLAACQITPPEMAWAITRFEGTVRSTDGRPVSGARFEIDTYSPDCGRLVGRDHAHVGDDGRFLYWVAIRASAVHCVVLTAVPPQSSGLAPASDTFPDVRFNYSTTESDTVRADFVLSPLP